jgi:uncharacterized protein (TIGR03086 family)
VYQRVITHFTELVDSISAEQWSAPTPCEGWNVRDLVEHVIVRDQRLAASVGGPPAADSLPDNADLAALWRERAAWWAAGLADPQRRTATWNTALGEMTFEQATTAFMTGELTIHGWDLARGLGVDDTQDPEAVHSTLSMMKQYGDAVRRPGALGPAVHAPPGSDEQTQLMAFTGRHV